MKDISVSIVNHGHDRYLPGLLSQLAQFSTSIEEVIVVHNVAYTFIPNVAKYPFRIYIIENTIPRGFATNHNHAFIHAKGKYFCILNPDIIFKENPFKILVRCLDDNRLGLVAPRVVNTNGRIEDSARYFPTPISLLKKALHTTKDTIAMCPAHDLIYSDWLAGMFLLLPKKVFHQLGGFDDKYWLYYEDVDLSLRCWKLGYSVALCNQVEVFHDGNRESHRHIRFFAWHISSMLRFFKKHIFRFPSTLAGTGQ